jgi:hypothetical protein
MDYSKSRPPVIKVALSTNLGFVPQMNILDIEGNIETLTSTAMTQVGNTGVWIYKVGDNMTVPDTYKEYTYYVASPTGNVIDEGAFSVVGDDSSLDGAIATPMLDVPDIVFTSGSISVTEIYPIRFTPLAIDGTFIEGLTETGLTPTLGPNITLQFQKPTNSGFNVTANMTLDSNSWKYDWAVDYNTPVDIVVCTISAKSGSKELSYKSTIKVVRPKAFNPQRVGVGSVS